MLSKQPLYRSTFSGKLLFIAAFMMLCFIRSYALEKTDSLEQSLTTTTDTQRINILNALSFEFAGTDNHKAMLYASEAKMLAEKLQYLPGLAEANYNTGLVCYYLSDYSKTLPSLNNALTLFTGQNNIKGIAKTLNLFGIIYDAYTLYDKALDYYLKALEYFNQSGDERGKAMCYTNISQVYHAQQRNSEAISYQQKALAIDRKSRQKSDLAISLINIADILLDIGQYQQALQYADTILSLLKGSSDTYTLCNVYSLLGGIYYKMNNFQTSLINYGQSASYAQELGFTNGIILNDINTGWVFLNMGNRLKADEHATKAEQLVKESKNLRYLPEIYNLKSEIAKKSGDYEKALFFQQKYAEAKDTLHKNTMSEKLLNLQTLYETEVKQQQIELLNRENEIKENRLGRQTVFIVFFGIISLLLAAMLALLYYSGRNRKKMNLLLKERNGEITRQKEAMERQNEMLRDNAQKLKEYDALKTSFFTNISHELRTPLTLILGPLTKLAAHEKNPDLSEEYQLMLRNARRLLELINQLLELSKLQKGFMKLQVRQGSLNAFTKRIVNAFESYSAETAIHLSYSGISDDFSAWFDADKIEKILVNLVTNAFKFTSRNGKIAVSLGISGQRAVFVVSDTGTGIDPQHLPHIFDPFFQGERDINRRFEGTGIGLALVKELIDLHHGNIEVSSRPGEGTTFTFSFPVDADSYQAAETDNRLHLEEETKTLTIPAPEVSQLPKAIEKTEENLLVLIVDDHADMRYFIRKNLPPDFSTLEAENGLKGFEMAAESIPDVIVADVMMPVVDGLEMVKKLKNDERTSHIPVIMLTARAGDESKIEGLCTRADDYLTKPFNPDELNIRLQNLIENRRIVREKYQRFITVEPTEEEVISVDDQFLKKALAMVEDHIADTDFDTTRFCSLMGMSRTNLHRKLKALTNQSATEFIRSIRLKKAACLLKQNAGNVSEIAWQTGFNNLSYFNRCFKEQFGINPSEYQK